MEEKNSDIPEIGKKINRFIDTLKRNPSKIYFSLFFIYLLGLLVFLVINITTDKKITIEENAINETIKLNDNPINLVSRTINKENNLVKLSFYYDNKSRSQLQDMNLNFQTITFSDMDYPLESEVIRATENYYVVFIKNVPDKFGALSTTISEDRSKLNESKADQKLEETKNKDSSSNIKIRGLQESFVIDNNLKMKDKTYYAKESVEYEIQQNKDLINKYEENILNLTDNNIDVDLEIKKIKSDIPYELSDKIPDLEREIINFEEKKVENKTEISKINDKILEVKDKINLLKIKKKDIK